jgi:hypothetical protein
MMMYLSQVVTSNNAMVALDLSCNDLQAKDVRSFLQVRAPCQWDMAVAWRGMAWLGLAWLGLAWRGVAPVLG